MAPKELIGCYNNSFALLTLPQQITKNNILKINLIITTKDEKLL